MQGAAGTQQGAQASLVSAGLLCHLEDMCLSQPCHREAQCSTNPLTGSTLCLCQPGYSGPTCHQDLDECQIGEAPCSTAAQAQARLTVGRQRGRNRHRFPLNPASCSMAPQHVPPPHPPPVPAHQA